MSSTTVQTPLLLHKNLGVSGVKVIDDEEGIVEAFVSGIGNKDTVGDIIQPGAFVDSLARRTPKGVWSHDWSKPVSKTLEIREVSVGDAALPAKMKTAGIGGLYVKTQFNLNTTDGRDAYENVKFFGEESEWSIGYQIAESTYDKERKALLLNKIELFEYSPVLFGANELTATVSVKVASDGGDEIVVQVHGASAADAEKITDAVNASLAAGSSASTESNSEEENMSGKNEEVTSEAPEALSFEAFLKGAIELHESEGDLTDDQKAALASLVTEATAAPVHAKAVPGSYEERYDALYMALQDAAGETGYAFPVATFDSSVVYYTYNWDTGEAGHFQSDYSIDTDGQLSLGDPTEVELVEVIVAKLLSEQLSAKGTEIKDLDVDALVKAGRMLSKSNREKLQGAADALKAVLDADNQSEDDEVKAEETKDAKVSDESADDEETDESVTDAAEDEDAEDEKSEESDTDGGDESSEEDADEKSYLFVAVEGKELDLVDDLSDEAKALIAEVVELVADHADAPELDEEEVLVTLGWTDAGDSGLIIVASSDEKAFEVLYDISDGTTEIVGIKEISTDDDGLATIDADALAEFEALMADIEAVTIDA